MSYKLALPAGIVKASTVFDVAGRWTDGQWVRFVAGKPEKIGGYEKLLGEQTIGKVRGQLGWVTSEGVRILTVGTYVKLYAVTDALQDITPIGASGTLGNDPFAVVNTDNTVIVTDTAHGLEEGAYVIFSGATAGGGITINGEYLVTVIIDADSYQIEHTSPATSTDSTTGGAAVGYTYLLNPGSEDTGYGTGFGSGPYGGADYGEPYAGADGVALEMRVWWIAKFGVNILASPTGGTLYEWDEDAGDARAVAVTGAPAAMRAMFVTAEGYVFALGTTKPMRLQWPDRDDIEDWVPTPINRANIRDLEKGNRLMAGAALSDVNLIWSDTAVYLAQYIGDLDIVYDTRVVGENSGLIGPMAFAVTGDPAAAYWMSMAQEFYMYSGGFVQPIPNSLSIRDFVFRGMNPDYAHKFWGGYNAAKSEVWFGYVSDGNTDIDRYVAVSVEDFSWTVGTLARTGMSYIPVAAADVIMTGVDRYIYRHEIGFNADGSVLTSYIQSGMIDIAAGTVEEADVDMDVDRYIHDFDRHAGDVVMTVTIFERPMSMSSLETADFSIAEGDTEVDTHMGGRHATLLFTSAVSGGDYRLGTPMFTVKPAGRR